MGWVPGWWIILLYHYSLHDLIYRLFWWRCTVMLDSQFLLKTALPLICLKTRDGVDTYQHILAWPYWLWYLEWTIGTIISTFMLQAGSSTLVAWVCLLQNLDFIDTSCIKYAEFVSAVALGLLISHTDVMYIPEVFLYHLPLYTSISCHTIFQLPTGKTIHYCIVPGAFHWNPRHVRFNKRSLKQCK